MLHVLIYKTEIVPVILCWCEILYLTLREEHRLWVCDSRLVRKIFDVGGIYEWTGAEDYVVS